MSDDLSNLPFSDDADHTPEPAPLPPPAPAPSRVGQRIAEASWISCGVAIILSLVISALHLKSRSAALILNYITIALMVLGLVLSVTALLGMRRWGKGDMVRPALSGLILSLALLSFPIRAMISTHRNAANEQAQRAKERTEQMQRFEQAQRDAFLDAGWFVVQPVNLVVVTLTSISRDNALSVGMLESVDADASLMLVLARNIGQDTATVDITGAVATMEDGSQVLAMDVLPLFKNARRDRDDLLRAYSPPLMLPPSTGGMTFMFFPHATNWQRVRNIALKVNGESQVIVGQYYSREEKQRFIPTASEPASAAP